ncbi:MAG: hypothetical protein K0Q55_3915 [Verrucomicrobia bacterium]|jgi:ABC-type branched-subunit amino acid transport system permease subunit|nr:hypothetical protein [Verrucomicrobiota bacterium]
MLNSGFTRLVLFGAAVLFSLAAIAKLATLAGGVRLSTQIDPVLFINNRLVLLLAAIAELVTVFIICRARNPWLKVAATAYLSTMLILYRMALWFLTGQTGCDCLGVITRYLPLSPLTVDRVTQSAVTIITLATYVMLLVERVSRRDAEAPAEVPALAAPPTES